MVTRLATPSRPPTRLLHPVVRMRYLKEHWWEPRRVSYRSGDRTGAVLAVRPPVASPYA